ncbi:cell wall metabolism sensor histidine kinase WalK [Geomicrobium sp. JCM 19039]|uniref:sensor histidine kinase n=1 Tax=Geomicrobium sp. JCM 19039 TaxID=1460636 RepID=UPI00045F2C7C|nr:HAMP domain-containing sensor histidine kinase [Geomicrobium sp. JCM 19039]GAK10819.1 phosphate regulon sensor protein PhoR [Geomicrobium sp. JCM 19039]
MNKRHHSLRTRIWITLIAVFLLLALLSVYVASYLYERLYVDEHIQSLTESGEELASIYYGYDSESSFLWRVQWTDQSSGADVFYFDQEHPLLEPDSRDNLMIEFFTSDEQNELLSGKTIEIIRTHPSYDQEVLGVVVPLIENEQFTGMILLSQPLTSIYEPLSELRTVGLGLLFMFVILFFITGKLISKEMITPIQKMERAALRMANGEYDARITATSKTNEINQLGESLNHLAGTLQSEEKNRTEFIGNVSHELRSPLGYIKGYAEGIEKGIIKSEDGIPIIRQEAESMLHLANDLLDLTKLQSDTYELHFEPVAFAQIVHDLLNRAAQVADEKSIVIHRDIDDSCIIHGDTQRLAQVVRNLLDNAINYSNESSSIQVTLKTFDNCFLFTIQDEGVGIPEEKVQHISERFYRVNSARSRSDGGSGVGLAIVDEIVKKHGGTFTVSSRLGVGTVVQIELPEYVDEDNEKGSENT